MSINELLSITISLLSSECGPQIRSRSSKKLPSGSFLRFCDKITRLIPKTVARLESLHLNLVK